MAHPWKQKCLTCGTMETKKRSVSACKLPQEILVY